MEVFRVFDDLEVIGLKKSSKTRRMKIVGLSKESLKLQLMSLGICLEWVIARGISAS